MKHRLPRPYIPLAVAAVLGAIEAFDPATGGRVAAQQATPAPTFAPGAPVPGPAPSDAVPPTPTPTPSGSPIPCGRHHKNCGTPNPNASPSPEPTSTPTSPAFATLDGTWELQLQYINETDYSYLVIQQKPDGTISGVWRVDGRANPFEGTYDGRLIKMLVHEPKGNVSMSGYVEGATDMVGIVDSGDPQRANIPFTAEHRGEKKGSLFKKKSS